MVTREEVVGYAKRLDEYMPGWEDRVDLSTLDMIRSSCCILGQAYPQGFYAAKATFFAHEDVQDVFSSNDSRPYWAEQIHLRRAYGMETVQEESGGVYVVYKNEADPIVMLTTSKEKAPGAVEGLMAIGVDCGMTTMEVK